MAEDIGWNSVDLQIEALIPGLLVFAEVNAMATSVLHCSLTNWFSVPASEFARGALFIAGGYSLGVVASLISRMLVDSLSERGPRKIVFGAFAHVDLEEAVAECAENDPQFKADLQREKKKRKCLKVAEWNAVYRSAVRRTTRREEVDRRRSQGRFVRNLLLPAIGAALVLFQMPWSVLFAIPSIAALVFVYAYAEYVNFAEAYDISERVGGWPTY